MLKYPIKPELFSSREDFDRTRQAVQDNRITTSDITSIIDSNCIRVYNDLVSRLFGCNPVDPNSIFKRDVVEEKIPINDIRFFDILVKNGYIGVCGRGYTFEYDKINLSDRHDRAVIKYYFEEMLTI